MSDTAEPLAPPVFQETNRHPGGWLGLILFFALSILSVAMTIRSEMVRPPSHSSQQDLLQSVLKHESSFRSKLDQQTGEDAPQKELEAEQKVVKELDPETKKLAKDVKKDPMAAKLSAAMNYERHQPTNPDDLKILESSRKPFDNTLYQIYSAKSLTRAEARTLTKNLPDTPFVYVAAKVHAFEKAGDSGALVRLVPPSKDDTWVSGIFFAMLAMSAGVWVKFVQDIFEGKLPPKGIPMDLITATDADRLAIRAAQILGIFILLGVIPLLLKIRGEDGFTEIGIGVLLLASIVALQKVSILGKRISLHALGLSTENLSKNVILGVEGFFAEAPIAMILGLVGTFLFQWLPEPTHPASEAIKNRHDLVSIIPILIFGSIIAPIWEEIVFRGLLFPSLKKVTGGIISAAVISSFLFASVHPQGPALLMSLAAVGGMSCYLSYKSRSLVPSIVMHCLHNTALFVLTIVLT